MFGFPPYTLIIHSDYPQVVKTDADWGIVGKNLTENYLSVSSNYRAALRDLEKNEELEKMS